MDILTSGVLSSWTKGTVMFRAFLLFRETQLLSGRVCPRTVWREEPWGRDMGQQRRHGSPTSTPSSQKSCRRASRITGRAASRSDRQHQHHRRTCCRPAPAKMKTIPPQQSQAPRAVVFQLPRAWPQNERHFIWHSTLPRRVFKLSLKK